jgi:hypothetical protein
MKKILFALLLSPLLSFSQGPKPLFKNDTLYTTGGYKIYKGQALQFAKGTGKNGKFRFISIKNGIPQSALVNNTVLITELKNFGTTREDDGYIDISGSFSFNDGSKGKIDLQLFFDKAIEGIDGLPGELLVPAGFVNNNKIILRNELKRLLNLYANGTIDRATYEAQKKKLLDEQ